MQEMYNPRWDLDGIFDGGSESAEFHQYVRNIEAEMKHLSVRVTNYLPKEEEVNPQELIKIIKQLESTLKKLREASAFVSCLHAESVKDEKANILIVQRSALKAEMDTIRTTLNQKLVSIDDTAWEALLSQPGLKEIAFVLNENREKAKGLLPVEEEVLLNDLAVDGYHAWNQMYGTIVGNMTVELEEDGEINSYSVGQASNKLSHPDRSVRKYVFEQLDKAWNGKADLFGKTLNHLAGFRLQIYKHRNWESVLKEPLAINRMKRETLDAMWNAITNNKKNFVKYLDKKAELLGLDKLSMYDIGAPISSSVKTSSYSKGAAFIIEQFRAFSPKMAAFAQMAFDNRWIEAEDRTGKRPGGFCTSFPDSEQTRIFMTYSGTSSNIATLAHELGHAYHQHVMNDVHELNQGYAMNVAETASTFAEMIVADASVKRARNKEEKKVLLEDKIKRSVAFFMNIHSRFIFENNFYEERKTGHGFG
ncbi:M3 family oligoendopeptidase [Virgibacillus ainsalahensis]